MKVAVIGGGLAGCAAAYILKKAGAEPVVFESSSTLASGASGNELGMYNPRFSAQRTPQSDFFQLLFQRLCGFLGNWAILSIGMRAGRCI